MISSACALQAFIRPTHLKGSDAFNSSVAPALFASSGIISSIQLRAAASISAQCLCSFSLATRGLLRPKPYYYVVPTLCPEQLQSLISGNERNLVFCWCCIIFPLAFHPELCLQYSRFSLHDAPVSGRVSLDSGSCPVPEA